MSSASGSEVLWTAAEAVAATGGHCDADWSAAGVSIDSRSCQPGDLFIALAGPAFDGHDYIKKALDAGAAAAMAHRRPDALGADAPLLMVGDTLEALTALGAAGRARSEARLVAVTGSVGKTGAKEALKACLGALGPTTASAASFNNHWGVPLSLARLPRSAIFGVFEIGMNHPGEIGPLSRLVRPDVAIITTVQPVHLAHFRNVLEIADAKAEIFEGMTAQGVAVLNRDHPLFANLTERARACGVTRFLTFGRHPEADVRLVDCSLHATCSAVEALVRGTPIEYCLSLPGEHLVINSLGVLTVVAALGEDVVKAAKALSGLAPLKGRGERHEIALPDGAFLLIDESYNANPTSVKAAVAVLGRATVGAGGRRIAVLGDMLELGPAARALHLGLAKPLVDSGSDLVFTCGSEMAALHEALPPKMRAQHAPESQALAALVAAAVRPGDAVMVKGSLGSRMAVVVEALKSLGAAPLRVANGE
jgi:UDP-N-acetylmuramoyl-tripeptide--D-alanyl-D-alanine ligase